MNAAYVHLALNDFPSILNLAGIAVLVAAFIWRHRPVARVALALLLAASLFAIPTYLAGEGAEELVEDLEGVNRVAIEPHEDAALWAFWLLCIEGGLALIALLVSIRKELPRVALAVLLLFAVITTAATLRTAYLGGKIHHPETEMGSETVKDEESGKGKGRGPGR